MKIEAANRLIATDWPKVGPYGLNGSYTTIFVSSPNTAEKFVQYLNSVKAKNISTGKRGPEYLISWDSPFVDVQEWRRKGFPVHASARLLAGRETGEGAGAIFYCPESENFLILLRSNEGDEGNTWCGLGGGRDNGEPLDQTVRREAFEEAGLDMDAEYELRLIGTQHHPDGFKFTNYLALIPEEFVPILNEEHTSYQWCKWQDFPENMHPKMMEALHTPEGQAVLRQYTSAFN